MRRTIGTPGFCPHALAQGVTRFSFEGPGSSRSTAAARRSRAARTASDIPASRHALSEANVRDLLRFAARPHGLRSPSQPTRRATKCAGLERQTRRPSRLTSDKVDYVKLIRAWAGSK